MKSLQPTDQSPTPLLEAVQLCKYYTVKKSLFSQDEVVRALDGVSFRLAPYQTLAVVGESGCGKSTLARLITMIETPTSGILTIEGQEIDLAKPEIISHFRRKVQIVFQDPFASLNPRQTIGSVLEEPLLVNTKQPKQERREAALAMMKRVGLRPEYYYRYPHMFSGGQRQRIAIARALMLRPCLLILDEPVSALDVSIQAQVLNLLRDLQDELGLAYLFISHDLSVVQHIADEVVVMYLGKTVEQGSVEKIFNNPIHPYSQALLSATPSVNARHNRQRIILKGEIPSPLAPPSGCYFHPRCFRAITPCTSQQPKSESVAGRKVSCLRARDTAKVDG